MQYTTLILLGLGLLGILIHNLVKIETINRKTQGKFRFLPFFQIEWPSILLSLCVIVVCLLAKHEIAQLEKAGNWLGLSFVAIGYMAQSLVYKFLGKAEKGLNEKPDTDNPLKPL